MSAFYFVRRRIPSSLRPVLEGEALQQWLVVTQSMLDLVDTVVMEVQLHQLCCIHPGVLLLICRVTSTLLILIIREFEWLLQPIGIYVTPGYREAYNFEFNYFSL